MERSSRKFTSPQVIQGNICFCKLCQVKILRVSAPDRSPRHLIVREDTLSSLLSRNVLSSVVGKPTAESKFNPNLFILKLLFKEHNCAQEDQLTLLIEAWRPQNEHDTPLSLLLWTELSDHWQISSRSFNFSRNILRASEKATEISSTQQSLEGGSKSSMLVQTKRWSCSVA